MNSIFSYCIFLFISSLLSSAPTYHRLQLFGNRSLGYYYTHLNIGRPLQPQLVLIDTGSPFTVIPCASCRHCDSKRLQKLYNTEPSFTTSRVKCNIRSAICQQKNRCNSYKEYCDFYVGYLDGSSVIGNVMNDQMSFDQFGLDIFKSYFGCVDFQHIAFGKLETNGIMGLSLSPSQNLLYRWFQTDPDRESQFSICLGQKGGIFEIGRPPIIQNYNLRLQFERRDIISIAGITGITFGEVDVFDKAVYKTSGLILDTGSTISYFPSSKLQKMFEQIKSVCKALQGQCYLPQKVQQGCFVYNFTKKGDYKEVLSELNGKFPIIYIQIDNQTIQWHPHNQYLLLDEQQLGSNVCLAIKYVSRTEMYILGDNFLRQRKIVFNLKDETISMIDNQTCIYQPYEVDIQKIGIIFKLEQIFTEIFNGIEFYIIMCLILIILAFRQRIHVIFNRVKKICKRKLSNNNKQQQLQQQSTEKHPQQNLSNSYIIDTTKVPDKVQSSQVVIEKQNLD